MEDCMSNKSQTSVVEKINVQMPHKYKVIFWNDQITTMAFVIGMLTEVFDKTVDEAVDLMLTIHQKGSGVAGIYIKSIAETKQSICLDAAKKNNFPLKVTIERD